MSSVRMFRLREDIGGVHLVDGNKRVYYRLHAGTVVEVRDEPSESGLINVRSGELIISVFVRDLMQRSEDVNATDA